MRTRFPFKRWIRPALLSLAMVFSMAAPVYAYIDPVTGSFLLQLAAGAILAGLLTAKRAWRWLISAVQPSQVEGGDTPSRRR